MNADPKSYNKPDRNMLLESDVDSLAQAVVTLTQELWVLADRQLVTEAVLAKHGIDLAEEVDLHQPDEDLQAKLDDRSRAIMKRVFNSLAGISSDE
ncbi:hypothetical protein [Ponticaulis sp.]|uniref:hypothetical protein n=1 Tax=Ponticaulis sp. TaxID=2020902 RepID=UPI000B6EE1DF|nr:hypothetical protein [Ponticaulis sp.]MAI91266.1 hypothetical protein [Ponticaulis sp.]OUX98575.1 MAG: hypothetical protein CBB65_12545 [Hyphomonadaceae bacterium TMED5]|tara:strand:+ start:11345 stop:11632 length:288 start_codon:yes stop_codon:yes gene_type:complete